LDEQRAEWERKLINYLKAKYGPSGECYDPRDRWDIERAEGEAIHQAILAQHKPLI
jgi:hypothetical protein